MANTLIPQYYQLEKQIQKLMDSGAEFYAKVDKDGKVLKLTCNYFDRKKHKKAKEDHKKDKP